MNRKVTTKRKSYTFNNEGHTDAPVTVATGVPGRFSSPTGKDLQIAARQDAEITHIGFYDVGQDVKKGDEHEDEESGAKYKIEYETPPSEPEFQRFMVSRVEQGT